MTGGCTSNHKITQHLTSQKVLDIALTVYFSLFSFFFCSYSTIQCALHLSPFSTLPPWHLTLTHQPPPNPTPTPPISKTKKKSSYKHSFAASNSILLRELSFVRTTKRTAHATKPKTTPASSLPPLSSSSSALPPFRLPPVGLLSLFCSFTCHRL